MMMQLLLVFFTLVLPQTLLAICIADLQIILEQTPHLKDIPDHWRSHPELLPLAKDPAHAYRTNKGSIEEAYIVLYAESVGIVKGPISRGVDPMIDFEDANGVLWDVKSPKMVRQTWEVLKKNILNSLDRQLRVEQVKVLLELGHLPPHLRKELTDHLKFRYSPDKLMRIYPVLAFNIDS